jgi:hypothetical protein
MARAWGSSAHPLLKREMVHMAGSSIRTPTAGAGKPSLAL